MLGAGLTRAETEDTTRGLEWCRAVTDGRLRWAFLAQVLVSSAVIVT